MVIHQQRHPAQIETIRFQRAQSLQGLWRHSVARQRVLFGQELVEVLDCLVLLRGLAARLRLESGSILQEGAGSLLACCGCAALKHALKRAQQIVERLLLRGLLAGRGRYQGACLCGSSCLALKCSKGNIIIGLLICQ